MCRATRLIPASVLAGALGCALLRPLPAQQLVTRDQAVAAALARGGRAALGRADTALAAGVLRAARAYPNPTFAATYTKDPPQYHYIADLTLDDSLSALDAVLAVQLAMGLAAEAQTIRPVDSLVPPMPPPPDSAPGDPAEPLRVATAAASLRAEEHTLALAHGNVIPAPSVQVGVEQGDPTEPGRGALPTIGVSLPLPPF